MLKGSRPKYLGVKDGKLARTKSTPNCVSSQAPQDDELHHIEPIAFASSSTAVDAMKEIKKAVSCFEGTKVITEKADYLYVEFSSATLGYVDDVELFASTAEKVIHVRSASRLGRKDFGVNRERVEYLREIYAHPKKRDAYKKSIGQRRQRSVIVSSLVTLLLLIVGIIILL